MGASSQGGRVADNAWMEPSPPADAQRLMARVGVAGSLVVWVLTPPWSMLTLGVQGMFGPDYRTDVHFSVADHFARLGISLLLGLPVLIVELVVMRMLVVPRRATRWAAALIALLAALRWSTELAGDVVPNLVMVPVLVIPVVIVIVTLRDDRPPGDRNATGP